MPNPNKLSGYNMVQNKKNQCEDCGDIAELTKYDDMVQDDDGTWFPGYHHDYMLCQKCIARFNYQTLQVYEDTAREREYLQNNSYGI